MIATDVYQVNVTWDMPKYYPDYYNVSLNMHSEGEFVSKNVSGVCCTLKLFLWSETIAIENFR